MKETFDIFKISEEEIKNLIKRINSTNANIASIVEKIPSGWPDNQRRKKVNEIVSINALSEYLGRNTITEIQPIENETEPDFCCKLKGEQIGIEVVNYYPSEKVKKYLSHWKSLCDDLTLFCVN